MKIAICDDEQACLQAVVTVVEDYSIERKIDLDYETFNSYLLLEKRIDEFDIFIMDYQTPEIDGLSFAKLIREKFGESKTIIFLTSFQDIVYETFAVRAHRFLIKPVSKEKFFEAMDAATQNGNLNKNLIIKNEGQTEIIPLNDILYIETSDKESYIYLKDEQYVCHKPMAQLEYELIPHGFFRVHRAYLINLKNVKRFDAKNIEMINDESVPMSKRRYKEFCEEYIEYNS